MNMDKKTLIKTAYLHFRDGQWDHAIQQYQKLLELDPSDVLALNMLGDVYARQGRVTEALQYYRQAIQAFNRQGATDKVEIVRRKMSKLDPNSVEEEAPSGSAGISNPSSSTMEVAGLNEALESLKSKIASDPKNLEHYQKLGDLLAKAGRNNEAVEQYLTIANALYNNRLFKKAEPVYQQIVQLDLGNLQARIALGEIYSKEGSDSEAKKEFLFVAENLIRQGNLERGQLFAQKAIQLKSIEAHYYLGLVYYLKGQMSEARNEFEILLKFKVSHQGALTHLAQIFSNGGQYDEAYGLYERLIKADAKNADALEKAAEIAIHQNKPELAAEKYAQAMESFAGDEQWERAATCASKAVKLNPHKPELYLKLADAAYNAGLEQQASEACLALSEVYASQGQAEKSAQMRQKARELSGESSPAEPSEPQVAAAPLPKPAEKPLAPVDEIKVMLNMAGTYIQQGSLDEAIEIYLKILKGNPNNEEVKTALTRAYAMFAGVNPEKAVARKVTSPAKSLPSKAEEDNEQRVQREAQMRAQREAQVRAQRNIAPVAPESQASPKASVKENELMQAVGNLQEDEIAGDHQDEFMTVTVAEIYTKQGLLNEALKIYQKILEIEPGNLEAQVKKRELEATMAEQERLRQQSEEAARQKKAKAEKTESVQPVEPQAAKNKPAEAIVTETNNQNTASESAKPKDGKDLEPPSSKGRRGRVSYV